LFFIVSDLFSSERFPLLLTQVAAQLVYLIPIGGAAISFPRFLRLPEVVPVRDVVDADLDAAEPGDVFLSHVSASAIEAGCLLTVDSLDLETLMKVCPGRRFVGTQIRSIRDAGANERCSLAFRIKNRDGVASTFPNYETTLRLPFGSRETDDPAVFWPIQETLRDCGRMVNIAQP
jgi:hypothetical protein